MTLIANDRRPRNDKEQVIMTRGDLRSLVETRRQQRINETHAQLVPRALEADGVTDGVTLSDTQTITGAKTFSADARFNGKLGIGTAPTYPLHVSSTQTDAASFARALSVESVFAQTANNSNTYRGSVLTADGTNGTNSSTTLEGLNLQATFNATGSGLKLTTLRGLRSTVASAAASTGNVTNILGIDSVVNHSGTGTGGTLTGVNALVSVESGAGTATEVRGVVSVARHRAANTLPAINATYSQYQTTAGASCVVTTARTYYALAPSLAASSAVGTSVGVDIDNHGSSLVTTSYGLRIAAQSGSGTIYAIYSNGGQSYHAGNLGLGVTVPLAVLHLKSGTATANTAPLKFTSGTNNTTAEAGTVEYNGRFAVTESDTTRRYVVQAAASTKTTAGAPYTNDAYVEMVVNGTTIRVMTTA